MALSAGLFAQLLVNTLQIGAVYVLFALGLTLVFGVMKVINFAHGQFFTLAALVIAATWSASRWPSSSSRSWVPYCISSGLSVTCATSSVPSSSRSACCCSWKVSLSGCSAAPRA